MQNGSSRLYGVLFTVVALVALVALIVVLLRSSFADDVTQQGSVANIAPSVDTLVVAATSGGSDSTSFTLTENTTTSLYMHGVASDDNGCTEIQDIGDYDGTLYRTNVASAQACTPDDTNCYSLTGDFTIDPNIVNSCLGGADTDVAYQATEAVEFFADPTDAGAATYSATDWTAYVEVSDGTDTDTATDTFEMNTLLSLNAAGTGGGGAIDYGAVAFSATAEDEVTVTVTGNADIDVEVYADGAMSCTSGSIPLTNTDVGLATDPSVDIGTSGSPLEIEAVLTKPTSTTPVTDTLYFELTMPASGVSGTCSNTVTFTAKADD